MNDCTVLFEAQGWGRARRVWDVPKWTIPWTCWLPQVFMKMMLIKMMPVYFNKSLSSESWYILYILQLRPYSGIWAKIWLIPSARALQRNNIKHPPPKNLNNFKNGIYKKVGHLESWIQMISWERQKLTALHRVQGGLIKDEFANIHQCCFYRFLRHKHCF